MIDSVNFIKTNTSCSTNNTVKEKTGLHGKKIFLNYSSDKVPIFKVNN